MTARDAESVRLLREARDLLWHDLRESRRHADDCPGCVLEAEIDSHLDGDT